METKRPCIRVRACRHVSVPDLHEAGRRLLPLARGPVTIQVVRDPMRGPGLPRGSGFLGRSGAPAVRLSACLFRDTWRSWTFPSRETGPGPLLREQDSGPQGSGCLDVVKDNYKALAFTQQEGVPQCWGTDSGPRAHLGRGTNPRVGPLLGCISMQLDCVGVLMERAGVPDP